MPGSGLECGGNRAAEGRLRLGFLIPAFETFGRPGRYRQRVSLNASATERTSSLSTLLYPNKRARNTLEMSKLKGGHGEGLKRHPAVQRTFEWNIESVRRLGQRERFHCLGQMHQ